MTIVVAQEHPGATPRCGVAAAAAHSCPSFSRRGLRYSRTAILAIGIGKSLLRLLSRMSWCLSIWKKEETSHSTAAACRLPAVAASARADDLQTTSGALRPLPAAKYARSWRASHARHSPGHRSSPNDRLMTGIGPAESSRCRGAHAHAPPGPCAHAQVLHVANAAATCPGQHGLPRGEAACTRPPG